MQPKEISLDDIARHNRLEELFYGMLGTDDCHKVGIMGGCGVECWIYKDGKCPEPDEIGE